MLRVHYEWDSKERDNGYLTCFKRTLWVRFSPIVWGSITHSSNTWVWVAIYIVSLLWAEYKMSGILQHLFSFLKGHPCFVGLFVSQSELVREITMFAFQSMNKFELSSAFLKDSRKALLRNHSCDFIVGSSNLSCHFVAAWKYHKANSQAWHQSIVLLTGTINGRSDFNFSKP